LPPDPRRRAASGRMDEGRPSLHLAGVARSGSRPPRPRLARGVERRAERRDVRSEFQGDPEVSLRLLDVALGAQEKAVVVVRLGVVRPYLERPSIVLLGTVELAGLLEENGAGVVRLGA